MTSISSFLDVPIRNQAHEERQIAVKDIQIRYIGPVGNVLDREGIGVAWLGTQSDNWMAGHASQATWNLGHQGMLLLFIDGSAQDSDE